MKKFVVLGSISLLLFSVSGCSSADGLVQEQIGEMNDLAQALETNAPDAKVKELQTKMEDTGKKLNDLKLSDDEKKKLTEKYQDQLTKAGLRLAKAMMAKVGSGMPGMPGMPSFTP